MKKLLSLFVFAIAAVAASAQEGYNYKEFAIGLDVSYDRGYTNIQRQDDKIGESINFIYNYSPYIPVTAELQFGNLGGGGLIPSRDKYGRQYVNHFEGLIIHGDFMMGEVIDYSESGVLNILKNFYFGSGGGIIFNNNTVQRTNIYYGEKLSNGETAPNYGPSTYVFPGQNSSVNFTIPLRFGYEFKIYNGYEEPYIAIDIGYIHNLVFGEGLDGYDDPSNVFKNNATNQYRQIVVGVKFSFGNITSYNKLIRRF
ncbi:MAG TPA: hypothetical protein VHC47_03550 [Mucilaginibacter sp.]|nr:hypothetical protein [Mucilaginibacter sp.]